MRPRAARLLLLVMLLQPGALARAEDAPGRLGQVIPISALAGKQEEDPVVAWDGRHYLVVWQSNRQDLDDYNVFGARISPDGRVLDPKGFVISTAPSNQLFLDLAWGREEYLAVWQDLRSRTRWEIYGARIRSDGTVLDAQGISIAVGERNHRHPQVAWDGTNFLVVWMEENRANGWDVAGARISPDGTVLDRERILIATGPGDQAFPVLAWGRESYLVVWMEGGGISGTRVDSSGKVLDPHGRVLSRSSRDAGYPSVAWGAGQFVVVWGDRSPSAAHALSGVQVRASGAVIDGTAMTISSSTNLQTFPSVRCAGRSCLVVWEEDQSSGRPRQGIESVIRDVRGAFLDLSERPVSPRYVMISPRAIGNHFTRVTSDGRRYLVVWKDYQTGTAASLGRLVTPVR